MLNGALEVSGYLFITSTNWLTVSNEKFSVFKYNDTLYNKYNNLTYEHNTSANRWLNYQKYLPIFFILNRDVTSHSSVFVEFSQFVLIHHKYILRYIL